MITINDKKYPALLKKIGRYAPETLYYKGIWDLKIFKNCLAVVGSRRMTNYGKEVIERIVGQAVFAGLTIVSGFMFGCDAQAHKVALKYGGRTIAVMPCGIDRIHPEYQKDLYEEILNKEGLVISEYPRDLSPLNWMYAKRNRIVAGLSRAVLVVEAAEKSGSLITAHWAKKFSRKIFVVPGPITSENSKGIIQLLKEGAEPVGGTEEILAYYKLKFQTTNFKLQESSKFQTQNSKLAAEKEVLNKLKLEAMTVDDLARTLGKKASDLGIILSLMELKGLIQKIGNKYHVS
jgi:DNA processing protein